MNAFLRSTRSLTLFAALATGALAFTSGCTLGVNGDEAQDDSADPLVGAAQSADSSGSERNLDVAPGDRHLTQTIATDRLPDYRGAANVGINDIGPATSAMTPHGPPPEARRTATRASFPDASPQPLGPIGVSPLPGSAEVPGGFPSGPYDFAVLCATGYTCEVFARHDATYVDLSGRPIDEAEQAFSLSGIEWTVSYTTAEPNVAPLPQG